MSKQTIETKMKEVINSREIDNNLLFYYLILNVIPKKYSSIIMDITTIVYNKVYRKRLDTAPINWNNVIITDNIIIIKMFKFFSIHFKFTEDLSECIFVICYGVDELYMITVPKNNDKLLIKSNNNIITLDLIHRAIINILNDY